MLNVACNACYLEFTGDTIYLYWTTDRDQAQMYIDNFFECVDIKLYDYWIDINAQRERGMPVALPEAKLFDCRYILQTI